MATVGTLKVFLRAYTADYEAKMLRSRKYLRYLNSSAQEAGLSLRSMGLIATTAAAATVYGTVKIAKAASDAEEIMNKFDVTFKEFSNEAYLFASDTARAIGRSTTDIVNYMADLQDTFVPLGFARDEAMDLGSSLTRLAIDVGSLKNVMDAEAIDAFTSAIVGNHRAVRKYGIVITEARLKQEAMAAGLTDSFDSLTNMQKVLLRYNIILHDSRDAMKDATNTAGTYANQVKRLKGNLKEMAITVGEPLKSALTKGITAINKFFEWAVYGTKSIEDFDYKLKEVKQTAEQAAKSIDQASKSVKILSMNQIRFSTGTDDPVKWFQDLKDQINTFNMDKWDRLLFSFDWAAGPSKELYLGFKELTNQMREMEAQASRMDKIRSFAEGIKDSLKTPLDKAKEFIAQLRDALKEGLLSTEEYLKAIADYSKKNQATPDTTRSTYNATTLNPFVSVSGMNIAATSNPIVAEQQETNILLRRILDENVRTSLNG
jgi:hypothetical protein